MEYWDPSKMDLSDDDPEETEDEYDESFPELSAQQRSQIIMVAIVTLLAALAGLLIFLLLGTD